MGKSISVTEVESRFAADAGTWVLTMRVHFDDGVVEFTVTGPELAPLFAQAGERIEREVATRC